MKYIIITITCLLFIFTAKAQNIKGGIIGGINLSQFDGDDHAGFTKTGINVGILAEVPLKENVTLTMEMLYNEKGAVSNGSKHPYIPFKLIMNYIDIPILINYYDKDKFIFGTGFAYGKLMDFKTTVYDFDKTAEQIDLYKSSGIEWIFNFRFKTEKRMQFNIRYNYSLFTLSTLSGNTKTDYVNARHNFVSMRLIYMLGKLE